MTYLTPYPYVAQKKKLFFIVGNKVEIHFFRAPTFIFVKNWQSMKKNIISWTTFPQTLFISTSIIKILSLIVWNAYLILSTLAIKFKSYLIILDGF